MMRAYRALSAVAVAALFSATLVVAGTPAAVADDEVGADPLAGTGEVTRTSDAEKPATVFQETYTENPGGVVADPLVSFGVPAEAAAPLHEFNRTLRVNDVALTDFWGALLETSIGSESVYVPEGGFDYYASEYTWAQFLPYTSWSVGDATVSYYLEQQFVQQGSYLVPTVRGLQSPGAVVDGIWYGSQDYNIIWGVGRAWSEVDDVIGEEPATRASVPFTLVNQEENCSFNGLMTFLFNDEATSRVHYQVASETCAYFKGNMWGNLPSEQLLDPVDPAVAEDARAGFAAEMSKRMPTKPLAELLNDYPSVDFDLDAMTQGTTLASTTAYGFVYRGVNYVSDCVVRTSGSVTDAGGVHPFCDQAHLPSYSTAKSIFMGGALLRLAEKYGPGVFEEKVVDWVPELESLGSWDEVTFDNLVDMATGHYDQTGNQVDEAGTRMAAFFSIENRTRASMMEEAAGFPSQEAAGERWVYHSSDSFILAAAMDAYLKAQEGASADIYAMLYDDVLAPIGVSADSQTSERTKYVDGAYGNQHNPTGVPWGGFGLWWTQDSIAKVGDFFNNASGAVGGEQVLNAPLLGASLQRDASDRGLATAGDPFMYNNGFWARNYTSADDPAYADDFWVPFMSGYGGITVAMMPNCSTFWRVSDNNEFSWAPVVAQSNKLDSMASPNNPQCRAAQGLDPLETDPGSGPDGGEGSGGNDGSGDGVTPVSGGGARHGEIANTGAPSGLSGLAMGSLLLAAGATITLFVCRSRFSQLARNTKSG